MSAAVTETADTVATPTITTTTTTTTTTTEGEVDVDGFEFVTYAGEEQLPAIMELVGKDLSEPYSIYTYRYFVNQWPGLCFLAVDKETKTVAGVCVSKLEQHSSHVSSTLRGYVAMLAVRDAFRSRGLGSQMVIRTINAMRRLDADEVSLEAEAANGAALRLYENLGFVRDKRLDRYYLNGGDAFRLKLWLK